MCSWGWHITHCLQPLFTEALCTKSWEHKAVRPPAFPYQQPPAFSPAAVCSWNHIVQRRGALSHARAGLLFTTSFDLLSWEHDQLCGLFPELPLFLLSCLPHSHFEHDQGHVEVSEKFPLALSSFLWWLWAGSAVAWECPAKHPSCLIAGTILGIKAVVAGLALCNVQGKDQIQGQQPCSPPLRLSDFWLHEKCQAEGINHLPEEKEALVNDHGTP